ncbi:MAG: hypothetical protein GY829_07180 [Gammaproteobacteria bacterium]|nr:hypothetical protein [Gammaproteobacteria bacterium]
MNNSENNEMNVGTYKYQWKFIHYLLVCLFIVALMSLFDMIGELAIIFSLQNVEQSLKENIPYRMLLLGGLHPVVVHFPIAFIAWLSFLEFIGIVNGNQDNRRYRNTMYMICCIMAVLAVIFGTFFMSTLSFSSEDKHLLNLHVGAQLLATTSILLSYYFFKKTLGNKKFTLIYQTTLFFSFVTLLIGSHFGGSMVHGTELLTEIINTPSEVETASTDDILASDPVIVANTKTTKIEQKVDSDDESISEDLKNLEVKPEPKTFRKIDFYKDIYPLIGKKCFRCHGPSRQKGALRLDSPMAIYRGGESKKPILTPYHPDKSLLYVLTSLPSFDKRRMPQKGRPLSDKQNELIYYWIMQGAVWPDKDKKK